VRGRAGSGKQEPPRARYGKVSVHLVTPPYCTCYCRCAREGRYEVHDTDLGLLGVFCFRCAGYARRNLEYGYPWHPDSKPVGGFPWTGPLVVHENML
jgi:hypothetical protein